MIPIPTAMDWRSELDGGYSRTWRFYKPYLSLLVKLGEPGKWVDLGAGLGLFLECCQRFGIECDGLEGDPHAVRLAKERTPGLKIETANILDALPYAEGTVAVVFCNQVIEHLPPAKTVPFLQEVRRILMPNGVLFVGSPSRFVREQIKKEHINLLRPKQLSEAMLAAGFEEVWPANYPRFILGQSLFAKVLMACIFMILPVDRLSATATAVAYCRPGTKGRVRAAQHFHAWRMLRW